jgi:hypothetical protein
MGRYSNKKKITWLFRKKRTLGNISIEQSSREVANAWPDKSTPKWIEVTHFSEGWRPVGKPSGMPGHSIQTTCTSPAVFTSPLNSSSGNLRRSNVQI